MNKAILKAADKIASQKWIPKWIREKVSSIARAFTDFIDSIFQKVIKKKIKVGDWEYSDNSYHNGDGSRPYQDSPNIIKEIINSGPAGVDPGKSNGLWWKVDGTLNGSNGTYELLLSPDGKTIWHFLFRSGK